MVVISHHGRRVLTVRWPLRKVIGHFRAHFQCFYPTGDWNYIHGKMHHTWWNSESFGPFGEKTAVVPSTSMRRSSGHCGGHRLDTWQTSTLGPWHMRWLYTKLCIASTWLSCDTQISLCREPLEPRLYSESSLLLPVLLKSIVDVVSSLSGRMNRCCSGPY